MDRVCPLLGLAADRHSAVDGVDGAHRCHAEQLAVPIERTTQAQLCLTADHERCERFLGHVARTGTADPGRSSVADGLVSTRLLLAPQPAWRGMAGRARSRPFPVLAAGAGVLALSAASLTVAGGMLSGLPGSGAVGSPSPSMERTPAPTMRTTPTETASPTSTATPMPSPTPTPALTPTPTPAPPTPAPTAVPQRTYVVAEGDTLAAIAQEFGTSVEAIQAANGIEDPNQILIGQVLVIP